MGKLQDIKLESESLFCGVYYKVSGFPVRKINPEEWLDAVHDAKGEYTARLP